MRRQGHAFLISGDYQSRVSLRAETGSLTNLISMNRVVQNWVLFVPINFVENHSADTLCVSTMSVVKKVLDQKTRNLKIFEQPFDSKIDETVSKVKKGYNMSIPSTS